MLEVIFGFYFFQFLNKRRHFLARHGVRNCVQKPRFLHQIRHFLLEYGVVVRPYLFKFFLFDHKGRCMFFTPAGIRWCKDSNFMA